MASRLRALASGLALAAMAAGIAACGEQASAPMLAAPLLPTLAGRQEQLDRVQLRGAGNKVLVTLSRERGSWRVVERNDWPADPGRLSQYLFVLMQARRAEAKTANPTLYARLGVQPVSGAAASGTELTLAAGNRSNHIVIGKEHEVLEATYVRVDADPQAWLTDVSVAFDPDPATWLDHRLVDVPLARVARVRVRDAVGTGFSLSHRDDRFRVDGVPSGAMGDSQQGDAVAGAMQQLRLEDVAPDDGKAWQRELVFELVDGMSLTVHAWHVGEQAWIRLAATTDRQKADAWTRQSGRGGARESAHEREATLNALFAKRRFLIGDDIARLLMLGKDEILAGAPAP